MDNAPQPPGEDATQSDEAKISDRCLPAYRRQAAHMPIGESVRDGLLAELCLNDFGDEGATLLGRRCQSRRWLALPTIGKSGVADHVDVGQLRNGEIGSNLDAAHVVSFRIKPFGGR